MELKDLKSVAEWARADGVAYNTAIKRRGESGLGFQVPPGTWLLTAREWARVKETPLSGCVRVRHR